MAEPRFMPPRPYWLVQSGPNASTMTEGQMRNELEEIAAEIEGPKRLSWTETANLKARAGELLRRVSEMGARRGRTTSNATKPKPRALNKPGIIVANRPSSRTEVASDRVGFRRYETWVPVAGAPRLAASKRSAEPKYKSPRWYWQNK